MKPILLAHNAVTAKLVDAPREAKLLVQQALSYSVDGFEHMRAFKGTGWDGRASFFEFNPSTFPRGFVPIIQRKLTQAGYNVQLVRKPFPEPLGPEFPVVDTFGEDPRYSYQREVVRLLLAHGQMIAQVATGGGKSRIAKLCFQRIRRKTLFLTTRSILMHQMKDAFIKDLKEPVGVFGDGQWTTPQLMNVGLVQSFDDKLDRPEIQALLASFEFVILEEAHEASGNGFYSIMQLCKGANYRLSLTATPMMKSSQEANMKLIAASGPIGIKVTELDLITKGILAKPYFKFVEVTPPKGLYRSTPWPKCYEVGVMRNEGRNAAIIYEAKRAVQHGLSVMVLVQRKEHGEILSNMLTAAGIKTNFIRGEHDQSERQAAISALKSGKIQVLIGSTILDVGVDVPAVGMVIIAGGGKAEVAARQRIGRGLREKKSGPNICFILDFSDPLNTHLREHANTRRYYVENTAGFSDGICNDFPYELLKATS